MKIEGVKFAYDDTRLILSDITCEFERGKITSIIGPNGCGKSTLLSLCVRQNRPFEGELLFDGKSVYEYSGREFASRVALVCQSHGGQGDMSIRELVAYGRTPHKSMFAPLNAEDEAIVSEAITVCGLEMLAGRRVDKLSGGERQRTYIALALAQRPEILFLDEPTTFLDIRHQLEIMETVKKINAECGITVVMVLHDINQAARYSDNIIVMSGDKIAASGGARTTVTVELMDKIFGVRTSELADKNGAGLFVAEYAAPCETEVRSVEPPKTSETAEAKAPLSRKRKIINALLIASGFLSLALGIVGAVLPILPSFPFLLLTLVCFSAGSEKFGSWFKNTKLYKKHLESFVLTRSMTMSGKIKAFAGICILISLPMIFVNVLIIRIVLAAVIVLHFFIFFVKIKTVSSEKLGELVRQARDKERIKNEVL